MTPQAATGRRPSDETRPINPRGAREAWRSAGRCPVGLSCSPTDHQLVEDQASDGQPRLRLLVHPRLGPLDPVRVADVFLTALGRGSGVARVMELEWRSLGLLQVERQAPRVTSTGKILHLHADTAPPRRASDGAVVGGRA